MRASDFADLIPECGSELLDVMYFTTVLGSATQETAPEESPDPGMPVAFSLRFAGDVSGRFGISLQPAAAHQLAANFLGQQPAEITSSDAADVAAELANMLCGSVMSRVEREHEFVLTHPEALPIASPRGGEDILYSRLDTDLGAITVWVIVEGTSCPR